MIVLQSVYIVLTFFVAIANCSSINVCKHKTSTGVYCSKNEVTLCACDKRGADAACSKKASHSCLNNIYGCRKSFYGSFISNFLGNEKDLMATSCRCNNGISESLSTRSGFCGMVVDNLAINKKQYFTSSIRFTRARNSYDYYAREMWNAIKSNISAAAATTISNDIQSFACAFTFPQCTVCKNSAHMHFGTSIEYYVCFDPRPCWSQCQKVLRLHTSVRSSIFHCLNGDYNMCPNISQSLSMSTIGNELRNMNTSSYKDISDENFCRLETVCEQKSVTGGLASHFMGDFVSTYPKQPFYLGVVEISAVFMVVLVCTVGCWFSYYFFTTAGLPKNSSF
jgi:hypothetical protein|tara:strand:+ start:623 stop:1636 length:1014 start_codon:yes stop_codon:yes gene_type:complete